MARNADPFLRCAAPKCKGTHLDGSPYCARHQKAHSFEEEAPRAQHGVLWALLPAAGTVWAAYHAYQLVGSSCDHLAFRLGGLITEPFACTDGGTVASGFAWMSPFGGTFVGSLLIALALALALTTGAILSPFWRRDRS